MSVTMVENRDPEEAAVASPEDSQPDAEEHPLQNTWVFWFDQPKKKSSAPKMSAEAWHSGLEKVYSFNTVEKFWALYNNLLPPSAIQQGAAYNLFKNGIQPMWEDKANDGGGRWHWELKDQRGGGGNMRERADEYWMYLLMGLIGELVDCDDDICGAVITPRRNEIRFSVWSKNSDKKQIQMEVGKKIRSVLRLEKKVKLGYRSHKMDETRDHSDMYIA
eukprot:67822_1